jgi:hypothetical protein
VLHVLHLLHVTIIQSVGTFQGLLFVKVGRPVQGLLPPSPLLSRNTLILPFFYLSPSSIFTSRLQPRNMPTTQTLIKQTISIQSATIMRAPIHFAHGRTSSGSRARIQLTPTRWTSTDSVTARSEGVQKAVNELKAAQASNSATFVDWRRVAYGNGVAQYIRAEQLVWLAKQSLAASVTSESDTTKAIQAPDNTVSQEQNGQTAAKLPVSTSNWAAPSVWAHLW